ncbi:cyclic nucleotide-binding domain-containing protein, partial [Ilumatobacter sp.]|uniref:cyclic nucleotide-binding domain-containing protein n=1 Tax=Ilumatobacter sp. TaxID=1967498 RepID=UPI003AF7710D
VLDHLAAHGSIDQYRRDETILAQGGRRDLVLLHAGRAGLLLRAPDVDDLAVLDIEPGEILAVVDESTETDRDVLITAVTDCEVIRIPPDAAAQAVALAPELAALLEQLATTQRRRIDRIVRRQNRATPGEIGPAADALHTQDDDSA